MKSQFPQKIFIMGQMGNSMLSNIEENSRFLGTRIEKLESCRYGSTMFYLYLEDIFTEFVRVFEFDKQTAVLPEPFGTFKSEEEKKKWEENHLLAIEFDYHIGSILYNYHEWMIDHRQLPDIVLGRMITDYPSVYSKVIYDYISVLKGMPPRYPFDIRIKFNNEEAQEKRNHILESMQREQIYGDNKAYFASFALPSLIERFMISFMQQDLVLDLLMQIHTKIINGELVLASDDKQFVDTLLNGPKYMNGSREDAMRKCRDIFSAANLIPDKDTEEIILGVHGRSPLTLGQFLRNQYAMTHIKKPYYDVLDILFSTKKVNLRNSIMHGVSINFDPFAMCFTAVMLQLFWAIIDREVFVKSQ